ncbi:MAG: hypothetical protein ACXWP4_05810, partial [Polyangiales bacterium]
MAVEKREISWKLLAIAALVLGVVAFAPSMFGEFLYDDTPLITHNPYIHSFGYWKRWFTTDFWDTGEEIKRFGSRLVYFRPAITASYAFDWKLGGGESLLFHLTNLLWHGAASLLTFLVLRRWIGAVVPAFLAAALFALHPTKAESVAWIAGRTDVFCMVAVLVATEGIARRIRGEKYGLAIEIGGTVLAYLTKEQAIVLPAFAAVETWVLLGRPPIDLDSSKKMIRGGLPQLVLALVYLAIRSKILPVRQNIIGGFRGYEYFGQIAETFGRYLELTIYPHDLSVQQALVQTHQGKLVLSTRYMVMGVCAVVALVATAIAMRKRAPAVTLGIALFFVTILPTSNVLPMGMLTMISERFLYMPLLGLAFAIGWALHVVEQRSGETGKRAAFGVAGVCAFVFLIGSMRRSGDYVDKRRFWAREMSLHTDSVEAWRFAVGDAVDGKRYNDALHAMMRGAQLATRLYSHTGTEADFIVEAADMLAMLTPDLQEQDLLAIDRFYGELLLPEPGNATLDVGPARIRIPRQGASIKPRIKALRPLIFTSRALIASRRGDDAAAFAFADQAKNECPQCVKQISAVSVVHARAGDYASAYKTLDEIAAFAGEDAVKEQRATIKKAELYAKQAESAPEGPIKLQLRGLELSTLDAWGRAYAVLRDY